LLAVVLEQAVEYGYLDRNPARGRKRLLKEDKPNRAYLQPEQVAALLNAAGQLDTEARKGDTARRSQTRRAAPRRTPSWAATRSRPVDGGQRCIGAPLANSELRVVLRAMLRRFRFEPTDGPEEAIRREGAALAPSKGGRVVLRAAAGPSNRRANLASVIA
jgi:Cytochrome P450